MKSFACWEVILLARNRGINPLIVERDYKEFIDSLHTSKDLINNQNVMYDIRSLRINMEAISFTWVNRALNEASHMLAKEALKNHAFSMNLAVQALFINHNVFLGG